MFMGFYELISLKSFPAAHRKSPRKTWFSRVCWLTVRGHMFDPGSTKDSVPVRDMIEKIPQMLCNNISLTRLCCVLMQKAYYKIVWISTCAEITMAELCPPRPKF